MNSLRARVILGVLLGVGGLTGLTHFLMIAHSRGHRLVLHMGHGPEVIFAAALLVAGLLGLRSGLLPFDRLRKRLAAVHAGIERRVEGSYPSEVQPLVNDLNALLDHRDAAIRRALAKAGDLAHGLKTPLAVLNHEADRSERAGQPELAAAIRQQVEKMRRQVEHHLAHARAAGSGAAAGARCPVAESAEGLARTLLRLHAERGIAIEVEVAPAHSVRCTREDLDEMLGNVLDNACKWAKSRVVVRSSPNQSSILITVDDDGPGLEADLLERVLQRGVRADEAAPGSGFGLAIVRDLAELYGGSISLSRSAEGGLRASLLLPGA